MHEKKLKERYDQTSLPIGREVWSYPLYFHGKYIFMREPCDCTECRGACKIGLFPLPKNKGGDIMKSVKKATWICLLVCSARLAVAQSASPSPATAKPFASIAEVIEAAQGLDNPASVRKKREEVFARLDPDQTEKIFVKLLADEKQKDLLPFCLEALAHKRPERAWELALQHADSMSLYQWLFPLAKVWAETNPAAVLKSIQAMASDASNASPEKKIPSYAANALLREVFVVWMKNDADAAQAAMKGFDPNVGQMVTRRVNSENRSNDASKSSASSETPKKETKWTPIEALLQTDPPAAVAAARAAYDLGGDDYGDRRYFIYKVFSEWQAKDFDASLRFLQGTTDRLTLYWGLRAMLDSPNGNYEKIFSLLLDTKFSFGYDTYRIVEPFFQKWANADLPAARGAVKRIPAGSQQESATSVVFSSWQLQKGDPIEMMSWLATLPLSESRGYAQNVRPLIGDSPPQDLLSKIEKLPELQRQETIVYFLSLWYSWDTSEFFEWMGKLPQNDLFYTAQAVVYADLTGENFEPLLEKIKTKSGRQELMKMIKENLSDSDDYPKALLP